MIDIVLASRSPRRRSILEGAGFHVLVHPARIDESMRSGESPPAMAVRLATEKATSVVKSLVDDPLRSDPAWRHLPLLAADTVVHDDDRFFDMPRDPEEACRILADLSGRWHTVTTGYCVGHLSGSATWTSGSVSTQVRFRHLGAAAIRRYVATGEPLDKAGAYGIQGQGGGLVAELQGSYTNVVGLPLEEVLNALILLGVEVS